MFFGGGDCHLERMQMLQRRTITEEIAKEITGAKTIPTWKT
jgi:hypothetical protein